MIKKYLAVFVLCAGLGTCAVSQADGYRGGHGYWRPHSGGGWGWVAPAVVGGVIVYEATHPPIYVQQPPMVVVQQPQQQVVVQGQNCSPWSQIQNPDGSITTTRTCQ